MVREQPGQWTLRYGAEWPRSIRCTSRGHGRRHGPPVENPRRTPHGARQQQCVTMPPVRSRSDTGTTGPATSEAPSNTPDSPSAKSAQGQHQPRRPPRPPETTRDRQDQKLATPTPTWEYTGRRPGCRAPQEVPMKMLINVAETRGRRRAARDGRGAPRAGGGCREPGDRAAGRAGGGEGGAAVRGRQRARAAARRVRRARDAGRRLSRRGVHLAGARSDGACRGGRGQRAAACCSS